MQITSVVTRVLGYPIKSITLVHMLQEFITKSIVPSHKSIISALRSAEIVGRGIVDLSRNFRVSEFPSFRTSKNVGLNLPINASTI